MVDATLDLALDSQARGASLRYSLQRVAIYGFLAVFALIIIPLGKKPWYRKFVVYPLSTLIALTAAYWTVQRLFFTA